MILYFSAITYKLFCSKRGLVVWCRYLFQFERGAFSLMGSVDPESFDTLHSFSNAFEMPFVTPWFPEKTSGGLISSKANLC